MQKLMIVFILVALTLSLLLLYFTVFRNPPVVSVHYHAGFLVYQNGDRLDFSDSQFMNYTACTEHDLKKSKEEEQIEKAHLHDNVGDVVHIHRPGAVWGDLFRNLNFAIPSGEIKGYLNSQEVPDILSRPIHPNDSVVITIGSSEGVDISQGITLERIREVESKSELCGT